MATKQKHIHKLKRHTYKSGVSTFFCTLPDCNAKMNPALALGKRSICWRCENGFILSEYSLRLVKPHCDSCHNSKNKIVEGEETQTEQTSVQTIKPFASLSERLTHITIQADSTINDDEGEI